MTNEVNRYTILGLLSFGSVESARDILLHVDEKLFEDIVERLFFTTVRQYINDYNDTPKDNLEVLFSTIDVSEIVTKIGTFYSPDLNESLITKNAVQVVRYKQLQELLKKATVTLINGSISAIDEVTELFTTVATPSTDLQITIIDECAIEQHVNENSFQYFPSCITGFQELNLSAQRGGLSVLIAKSGHGKTMYLDGEAIACIKAGYKVLRFTMDATLTETITRIVTALNRFSKDDHGDNYEYTGMILRRNNTNNRIERVNSDHRKTSYVGRCKLFLTDADIAILKRMTIVVGIDTQTSVSVLHQLIQTYKPDLVQIDYPRLFKEVLNSKLVLAYAIPAVFSTLRGMAVKYNVGMSTVHQVKYELTAEDVGLFTAEHAAEGKAIMGPASTFLTITMTQEEKEIGLGKIYVAKSRRRTNVGSTFAFTQDNMSNTFCTSIIPIDRKDIIR